MKKFWPVVLGVALFAANACDEGEYNELKCDASFEDECVSYDYYATCRNGIIETVQCPEGMFCRMDANGKSDCADANGEETGEDMAVGIADDTCEGENRRCLGDTVQTCVGNRWVSASEACAAGCAEGSCL